MDSVLLLAVLVSLNSLYVMKNGTGFFFKRYFWGILCVIAVLACVSGQIWNRINGPPFAIRHPHTQETLYVYPSNRFQLLAETYMILVFYAATSFSIVLINMAFDVTVDETPKEVKQKAKKKTKVVLDERSCHSKYKLIMIYSGLVIFLVFFSMAISLLRQKLHGYPFRLLFN